MDYLTDGGEISVRGYLKDKMVYVSLKDNGQGMTPDELESLLSGKKNKGKGSGVGIKNVKERIQVAFGSSYTLEILSEPDEGTEVLVKLPYLTLEAYEKRMADGEKNNLS